MQGVRHDKIGQMVHIDNSDKYKEDPVLQVTPLYFVLGQLQKNDLNLMMRTMKSILFFSQRLFKSAGIDQNHLGPGAMDFAVKFAQVLIFGLILI